MDNIAITVGFSTQSVDEKISIMKRFVLLFDPFVSIDAYTSDGEKTWPIKGYYCVNEKHLSAAINFTITGRLK